jgi:hypothetical protein
MGDEELSLEDLDGTVRTIVALWGRLRPADRSVVMRLSPDLHDALAMLGQHATDKAPRKGSPPMEVWNRRAEALRHARKAWGGTMSEDGDRHARNITALAQAFDRFLVDGTVHEVPDDAADGASDVRDVRDARVEFADALVEASQYTWEGHRKVHAAALAWVDRAHLKNPSGLENWRNWSDEHDQNLIDAVLAYRGLPPLERKQP